VTIYSKPDGGITNVAPEDREHPLDTGAFAGGVPLDTRGRTVTLDGPSALSAHVVDLARRRTDEQIALEVADAAAEADRRRQYRSQFTAEQLEAADLLGIDPTDVLSSEVLDGAARIATTGGVWENDGRGWRNVGPLSASTTAGPFGLVLRQVSEADLTDAERAELDVHFPPQRPGERAEIFRTVEGLVVGDGRPDSRCRTLLPGASGRDRAVGLMWPQDMPPEARRERSGFKYNLWAGPGSCVPATSEPTITSPSPVDAADRPAVDATRHVAQTVLDACDAARQLRDQINEVWIAWETANSAGANLILFGQHLLQPIAQMIDALLVEEETGPLSIWRVELEATTAKLDTEPPPARRRGRRQR
jgi:hypothetical protein